MRLDISNLLPADTTLSHSANKDVTLENAPNQGEAKQILSDIARKVVLASDTGVPTDQKLKLELQGRDVTLRTRGFGSGSHAASSFIKALALNAYGPQGAAALEKHIAAHGDGKHLSARDFVQFVSGLEHRDGGLQDGDPLSQVRNPTTHKQFDPTLKLDVHAPVKDPSRVQPEDLGVGELKGGKVALSLNATGNVTEEGIASYVDTHRAQLGLQDIDNVTVKRADSDVRGSWTVAIFIISVNNAPAFIAKESGTMVTLEGDDGRESEQYFGYKHKKDSNDGRYWAPNAVEDDLLAEVEASDWARVGPQRGASGVTVDVAHTEASFRYAPPEKQTMIDDVNPRRVEHSVSIARLAPGETFSKVLDGASHEEKKSLWEKAGDAVGTLHLRGAKRDGNGDVQFEAGGVVKTVIHGDLHPGNFAYDRDSDSITFFDLAGVARSLEDPQSPPFDNTRDLARIVGWTLSGDENAELRTAFLSGYVNALSVAASSEDGPDYDAASLEALVTDRVKEEPRIVSSIEARLISRE